MSKVERDKIYYGEATLLNQDLEISKSRSILYTSSSPFVLASICEDIFYESPQYLIFRDYFEAKRHAAIFPQERIYVLRTTSLYHLLKYFGFPRKMDEESCIAMKENLFNGVFAYENCELFGYKLKTNTYWKNGILVTNDKELTNNKYDYLSYERFAENDLTPYFQVLNKIPFQNPEDAFEPLEEEGLVRKKILCEVEENVR